MHLIFSDLPWRNCTETSQTCIEFFANCFNYDRELHSNLNQSYQGDYIYDGDTVCLLQNNTLALRWRSTYSVEDFYE